jgi:diguanylate cyclase (GGDEF)-like protein
VLLLDLDDFKAVNDSLGHQEGDRLLCVVADRLAGCIRPGDTLARLGGDEFAVLTDDASAEELAGRILAALAVPVPLRGAEVQAHASIGIRVAEPAPQDVDQLLRDADLAMYAAKASGRGTWRRFHPSMYEHVHHQLTLRAELRRALDPNEFALRYQPVVEVDTLQIVGFEALICWQHPRLGHVSPDHFIPEAEQSGLIIPIGAWVLREACSTAVELRAAAGRDIVMSVNISPRQLQSDDIVEVVQRTLLDTGLPADALCLEITESILVDDDALVDRLRALRESGVHLAIDDFGTGFSSYSYLQTLPVDSIKIDRTFVERLGPGETTPALARDIVRMSQALRLTAVAEGVETPEQYAELRELGCPLAQGYLFDRPLHVDDALARLGRR